MLILPWQILHTRIPYINITSFYGGILFRISLGILWPSSLDHPYFYLSLLWLSFMIVKISEFLKMFKIPKTFSRKLLYSKKFEEISRKLLQNFFCALRVGMSILSITKVSKSQKQFFLELHCPKNNCNNPRPSLILYIMWCLKAKNSNSYCSSEGRYRANLKKYSYPAKKVRLGFRGFCP